MKTTDLDISEYEDTLRLRKEKLRELLSSEETNLMEEIIKERQCSSNYLLEERRAMIQEAKKQQAEEHDAIVATKRMQQHLNSCEDIRLMLSRRRTIDAKQCNVGQMEDNKARISAEKDLEAQWHNAMVKDLEEKKRREMEESEKRTLKLEENVKALAKLVMDKSVLQEEKKRAKKEEWDHMEQLREDMRQMDLSNLEEEKRKRENLKREFEEQILIAKKYAAECADKEAAVDHMFKIRAEEELSKEKAKSKQQDIASRRAESLDYLKYQQSVKQEIIRRDMEAEAAIEQSIKDAEANMELAKEKIIADRKCVLQSVLLGREEQLRARQEANERDKQLQIEEKQALETEIEMNINLIAMKRKEKRVRALRYRQDLMKQMEYLEMKKRRELDELRIKKEEEKDKCQRWTLDQLDKTLGQAHHPFWHSPME